MGGVSLHNTACLVYCRRVLSVDCVDFLPQLQKRHDLLSVLMSLFKAQPDTVVCCQLYLPMHTPYATPPPQTVVFQLSEGDMDSFVFAIGQKKAIQRMHKEYEDLVRSIPISATRSTTTALWMYLTALRPATALEFVQG